MRNIKNTLIFGVFLAVMVCIGTIAGCALTNAMTGESPVAIVMRWREEDFVESSKPESSAKKNKKDNSADKSYSKKDSGAEGQNAPSDSTENGSSDKNSKENIYKIGETWTVDGQWTLTVTGVEESDYRSKYTDKAPSAVYVISYSYTNLGYVDESGIMDGLYFGMEDTVVDYGGIVGYSYPGEISGGPRETPEGATCNAQSCIGVDNAGNFKMIVTKYDGNGVKQSATFEFDISQ